MLQIGLFGGFPAVVLIAPQLAVGVVVGYAGGSFGVAVATLVKPTTPRHGGQQAQGAQECNWTCHDLLDALLRRYGRLY